MSNIESNIHIIQPVIPEYRVDYFERLKNILGDRLYIYCSSFWPNAPKLANLDIDKFNSNLNVVNYKSKIYYQSITPILKNIKRSDTVIISGDPRLVSNYLIIIFCKVIRAKIVWWGHGWSAGSRGNRSKLRQKIMRLADIILLYTDSEKYEYEKNNYVNKPIFALNNGLDIEKIDLYFEKDWVRFNHNGNVAIYCGRLTNKSNILLLLEAVKKSKQLRKLIIVGDGDLFESCQKFICDNELTDRVDMLGEVYEPQMLAEIFSKASLFVFPGTIGLSLIHAMAHGLPVILHDNRHNHGPENVAANNKNSLFFRENDSDSLSESIDKYFLLDVEIKLKLAQNARRTVEETFNTKCMAENFIKMLRYLNVY